MMLKLTATLTADLTFTRNAPFSFKMNVLSVVLMTCRYFYASSYGLLIFTSYKYQINKERNEKLILYKLWFEN